MIINELFMVIPVFADAEAILDIRSDLGCTYTFAEPAGSIKGASWSKLLVTLPLAMTTDPVTKAWAQHAPNGAQAAFNKGRYYDVDQDAITPQ